MTGGAHGVPVHALAGPVAPVSGLALVVAEDIEPLVLVRIIADIASLQAAAGRGDEELAQRVVADDAHHRKVFALMTPAAGQDVSQAVLVEKGLGAAGTVIERLLRGKRLFVHLLAVFAFGETVIGILPAGVGGLMAFLA